MQRQEMGELYTRVRGATETLAAPLQPEDCVVQSMPDVSPTRWHLAHTTWFFERFVLREFSPGYRSPDERFDHLFNSYYQRVGEPFPRDRRGLLSRPTVAEVLDYRRQVDAGVDRLLAEASGDTLVEIGPVLEVGVNHEEQHQELVLTDIKHVLAQNPLRPAYAEPPSRPGGTDGRAGWIEREGGVVEVGHSGAGFAYDNETPRHRVWLEPHRLASRPSTCAEYLRFMEDGGYDRLDLWLADGWAARAAGGWEAPLYWFREGGAWRVQTLGGPRDLDPREPVCHVSYYEADAFARWSGARLPTEAEWENAAAGAPVRGNLAESRLLHPAPAPEPPAPGTLGQVYGDVWEWTSSPYTAYPAYRPYEGALGEYNGKFMCNQMVLRGGSCATPARHIRATYRNFFYPASRWQFSGVRLAS